MRLIELTQDINKQLDSKDLDITLISFKVDGMTLQVLTSWPVEVFMFQCLTYYNGKVPVITNTVIMNNKIACRKLSEAGLKYATT